MAHTRQTMRVGPSLIRRISVISVMLTLVIALPGCSVIVPYILPSRPYDSFYLANRDGHYYAGDRCSRSLVKAGVFLEIYEEPPDFSTAIWHIVIDSNSINEFEVYATDQIGVTVMGDDGTYPIATPVVIYYEDSKGRSGSGKVVLNEVTDGMVSNESAPDSWDDFMRTPRRDFGC